MVQMQVFTVRCNDTLQETSQPEIKSMTHSSRFSFDKAEGEVRI